MSKHFFLNAPSLAPRAHIDELKSSCLVRPTIQNPRLSVIFDSKITCKINQSKTNSVEQQFHWSTCSFSAETVQCHSSKCSLHSSPLNQLQSANILAWCSHVTLNPCVRHHTGYTHKQKLWPYFVELRMHMSVSFIYIFAYFVCSVTHIQST